MQMFISADRGIFELWITSQYTLNMLSIEINYEFLKIAALLKQRGFFCAFSGDVTTKGKVFFTSLSP